MELDRISRFPPPPHLWSGSLSLASSTESILTRSCPIPVTHSLYCKRSSDLILKLSFPAWWFSHSWLCCNFSIPLQLCISRPVFLPMSCCLRYGLMLNHAAVCSAGCFHHKLPTVSLRAKPWHHHRVPHQAYLPLVAFFPKPTSWLSHVFFFIYPQLWILMLIYLN